MTILEKREFDSEAAMAASVMERIITAGSSCRDSAVMLTGGSFATMMSNADVQPLGALADHLTFLLSDERHVPDTSKDSNYKILKPFISRLGVEDRLVSPDTRRSLVKCASGYCVELQHLMSSNVVFETAFLGLGKDGHFASMFGEKFLDPCDAFAVPVRMPDPPDRITATLEFLWFARKIVFTVPGRDKTEIVEQALAGENRLLNRLLEKSPAVEVWVLK